MLQKCERVDFRAGAVFDGLKSRKMAEDHEKRIQDNQDQGFCMIEEEDRKKENSRDDDGAERQPAGQKDDKKTCDVCQKTVQRVADKNSGTGDGNPLAAFKFAPERKIVPQDASQACVKNRQMIGHGNKKEAHKAGQKSFSYIACENRKTTFNAKAVRDVRHSGISGSKLAALFVGSSARYDFSSQKRTKQVSDKKTEQTFHNSLRKFD